MKASIQHAAGFTLIEIMITATIIGILAAIAIPYYRKSGERSRASVCVANMKSLEGAVEQRRMQGIQDIDLDSICGSLGYIRGEPRCPSDKTEPYEISGPLPVCPNVGRYPDHVLKPR